MQIRLVRICLLVVVVLLLLFFFFFFLVIELSSKCIWARLRRALNNKLNSSDYDYFHYDHGIVKQLLKNDFDSTKDHFFLRLSIRIFKGKSSNIVCSI